jgi:MucR family transcriptional regulator, transcriptional regulator of exopolysaccharide biosynthesis
MVDENEAGRAANVEYAANIVSAFVSNNPLPAAELPDLVRAVHTALFSLTSGKVEIPTETKKQPAVPIKKSVTPDFIICLEDGKKFKSLRRHLNTAYGMTPEEYRARWGLPPDYPMVAPNYAQRRSELAMSIGLGRKAGKAVRSGKKT